MQRDDFENFTLEELTSRNPEMQRCLSLAREVAGSELPILLLGETGTGKTLLARAIHYSSQRRTGEFISFNASAMSDTLLESQLFGHEKGAFTGATVATRGKFELAHNGTLFFDEIADMSPLAQAKILRAVEYGEFERLGSEKMSHADVRVISATNRSLRDLAGIGGFREDLFHRLNGITIVIPPLRARPEDLPGLIAFELKSAAQAAGKVITAIHPQAYQKLVEYAWPGNLRELHRVVQTVVLFTKGDTVLLENIMLDTDLVGGFRQTRPAAVQPTAESPRAQGVSAGDDLTLTTAERRHIDYVYQLTGYNKRQTAQLLNVSRSTLDRKLNG